MMVCQQQVLPTLVMVGLLLFGASLAPVFADDHFDTNLDKFNITEPEIVITPKIVGGNEAPLGAYPFFAHSTRGSLCGGALIASDIVLTAAHCTNAWQPNLNENGVIIGSINRRYPTSGGVYRRIESVLKHPSYSSYSQRYDIMLVKLSQPVTTISPVELNENSQIPSDYAPVTAVGYGATQEGGGITNTLMQVNVNIVPQSTCDAQYSSPIHQPSMVCAGVPGGGKDACQGDSGGPLLTPDNKLVGVVSFGVGCARASHAGVYARVSTVSTWIKEEVCNLSSNKPTYCNPVVQPPTNPPTFAPTFRPTTLSPTSSPTETPEYVRVKLVMKYDNAPSQTSWEINAQPSGREVFSGPIVPPQANSQVPYVWNLFPTGDYTISIYDTGFNGLALNSYFDIIQIHSDGTEVTLAEGTEAFLFSTTVPFTVYPDGEGPVDITTQVQTTSSTTTTSTTTTSTTTSTSTATQVPETTTQQSTTTLGTPASGGSGQQYERVKLIMKYDDAPSQTEWEIKDVATGQVLFDGPDGPTPQANSQVPFIWNLFPTGNYSITIFDFGFNGLQHASYFELVQLKKDGSEITLAEGNEAFLFSVSFDFTVYPNGEPPIESTSLPSSTTSSTLQATTSSSSEITTFTTPKNSADLRLVLNYGASGMQRFWEIRKAGTLVLEGPVNVPTSFSEETVHLSSVEFGSYEITVYDMNLQGSQDTFRIFQTLSNGEDLLIAAGGGSFVEKESFAFVVSAAGVAFVTDMPSSSPTSHPSSSNPSSSPSQSPVTSTVTTTSSTTSSSLLSSTTTPGSAVSTSTSASTTSAGGAVSTTVTPATTTAMSFGPPVAPAQATIRLTMKYDSYPEQTSWSIVEGVNTALYTGPDETPEPNSVIVQEFSVPYGFCKFRVSDLAVNGMEISDYFRIDQIMSDGRVVPLAQSSYASFGLAMVEPFTVLPDTTTVKVKVQYANSDAPRSWEIYGADAEGNRGGLLLRDVQQDPVPDSEKVFTLSDFSYGEYFVTAIDTTPPSSGDVLTIYQAFGDGTEVEMATTGEAGFVFTTTEHFTIAPRIAVPHSVTESPSSSPSISLSPSTSQVSSSNPPTPQVTVPPFAKLKLTVRFDDSPSDIRWKIKRGYTEYLFFGPDSIPAANAEVVQYFDNFEYGDNYLLQFSDAGFNGIVRSDGKPFVTLSQVMPNGSERVILESNQSFGYVLTLNFVVEP